ncbi:MAG: family 10 glycosylhydrolase [bacterium]
MTPHRGFAPIAVTAALLAAALLAAWSATVQPEPADQIRAVWVTRWAFKSPDDVKNLFDRLSGLGVNTVFFQVRGAGDAFYRSSHEPWSATLSGSLGRDPGWDPLRVAVREGHRRGLDVHAWVNVFTAWQVTDSGDPPPVTEPLHPLAAHPEWVCRDRTGRPMSLKKSETADNYAFFSPTRADVGRYITQVLSELVGKYNVDGLHLDYVRFPDSSYSYDKESRIAYLKDTVDDEMSFAAWRRERLTEFVGQLGRSVKKVRPEVAVSAAVWQIIDAGRTSYYQDGVEWLRRGYVDFLVPMIYTPSAATFESRLTAYADSVGGANVVAGLGAYMEGFNGETLVAELEAARRVRARGVCIFNSDYALAYADSLGAFFGGDGEGGGP